MAGTRLGNRARRHARLDRALFSSPDGRCWAAIFFAERRRTPEVFLARSGTGENPTNVRVGSSGAGELHPPAGVR